MHINSSIPNLIGGVSQQPDILRLPSHMEAQENGYSTASRGLGKRPPTRFVAEARGITGTGFHHILDMGPRGVFFLSIDTTTGQLRMANSEGYAVYLYNSGGAALGPEPYLATPAWAQPLKIVQEADTAFLINPNVTVQSTEAAAPALAGGGLVWVKSGNYGREYRVSVPGKGTASYTTPDGSTAAHVNSTRTDVIAASLSSQLAGFGVANTLQGSVITLANGSWSGITVSDGSGGSAIGLVYGTVRSVADLPSTNAGDGFTVKVEGGDATGAGDYYLTWDKAANAYKEAPAPLVTNTRLTDTTMPLMLQPYQDGFRLSRIAWGYRKVGDKITNPNPTFIGKAINDICFYQDRMVVLSGEEFNISETGEYFNFYRTTVTDLLDSDPISGVVSPPKVSTLRHAVPFNKRLLLFSDKAQFELSSGDSLTPKNFSTPLLTQFDCSAVVRPLGIGNSLYFPVSRATRSALFNFFVNGTESLEDAVDVSGHVPNYIPPQIVQAVASPVNNVLMLRSAAEVERGNIYVYQFYQDGAQRLQSAWHRWTLTKPGEEEGILSMNVVGDRLYLLMSRGTGYGNKLSIEYIQLGPNITEPLLDRRVYVDFTAGVSSGPKGGTGVSTPYMWDTAETYYAVVTRSGKYAQAGLVLPLEPGFSNSGWTPVDLSGCLVEVGQGYTFRTTLGRFMTREQAGQGSIGVSRGRTQIGRLWVNFSDAVSFSVEVAVAGRPVKTYTRINTVMGNSSVTLGAPTEPSDGRFSVPVQARNTDVSVTLVNDTPVQASFLSVDWEGLHIDRGRHV